MTTKCAGLNCRFPEENHSPECIAEHAASAAGGRFVPSALAVDAGARDERDWQVFQVAGVLPLIKAMEKRERDGALPPDLQEAWSGFAIDGYRADSDSAEASEPKNTGE